MSITSVVNDLVTSVSVINALKPLPPTISGYSVGGLDDTALDPAGGQTVQINGTGFLAGATITFDGSAVAVVTYVNPNRLTFTSPAKTAGTYTIYAVNPDGGTAIFIPGIIYSVLPTWTTSAGSLGSYYETTSISNTVVASGDAPITYSLFSGSLPTGSTLYANGVITGTAPVDSSSTTYSFTIEAIDAQLQGSTRSFSLTINTDVVTWVSPANATTYTSAVDSAIANVTLSATDAAGYAVSYSANALPTGLSLSGANISGTPTVIADSSTLLTATAATTNRTAVRTINWSITVANDPYFEYNTLLIPGASTTFVDDASTNNFAVTINGDTKPNSMNPYSPGYYSVYSNNTGVLSNVTTTTISAGVFTFEGWFNLTAVTAVTFLMGLGTNTGGSTPYFNVSLTSSGTVINVECYSTVTSAFIFNATYTWPLNRWVHLAAVGNGTTVKVYVNGVGLTTTLGSGTFPGSYLNTLSLYSCVGGLLFGGGGARSDGVNGYVSNFRFVNGTAVYTADFTPSTTPLTAISGTAMLACQSNRLINSNNVSLTTAGVLTINSFDPFVPNSSYSTYGSGYFDGTGDYIKAPANATLSFDADFCIECWVNTSTISLDPYGRRLWSFGSGSGTYLDALFYDGSGITSNLCIQVPSAGIVITGTIPVANSQWNHVALTRSGSSMKLFVNGVQSGSTYTTAGAYSAGATNGMYIGCLGEGVGGFFLGSITDLRVVKGTAVYTTTFTPPTAPLTAIANTSLLTLQNNQSVNNNVFLDNSTNNFFVTRNGNTTQGTFSPYGGNWSNYFDGTGDYLNTPSNAAFGFGTGDFTIEGWFYFTGTISTYQRPWWFGDDNDNLEIFSSVIRFGGANETVITGPTAVANTWYHIAYTRQSSSGKLFVNGTQVGSTTASSYNSSARTFTLMATSGGANPSTGYVSNFRIIKGTALYTTTFTPSTTPLTVISGTSLLTCQSNRIVDNSINNFTITKFGDTSVQRFSPFNPSSVTPTSYSGYFDGTGDYLTVPFNSAFNLGSGNFTIEFWVRTTSTAAYATALRLGDTWTTGSWALYLNDAGGSGVPSWWSQTLGQTLSSSGATINDGAWHHIALVRISTTMTMYIDGTSRGTLSVGANSVGDTTTSLWIARDSSNVRELAGYLSNIRIVKGTGLYTTSFTPSTTPLTTTSQGATASQVSLLTLQSPTFIDNSTNNFAITAFGNSQPSIQNPFGYTSATTNGYTVSTIGGSGYFDGTGDYLSYTGSLSLTGAFTVQGWFYNTTTTGTQRTLFVFNSVSGNGYGSLRADCDQANTQFNFSVNMSTNGSTWSTTLSTNSAYNKNVWNHFAVTRDSSNAVKVFINGVQIASGTQAGTLYNTSTTNAIGCNNLPGAATNPFNGYISDLQLINGTALYTSNFVPPSAPLLAVQNTVSLLNMTSAGVYDAAMMNNVETVGDAKLSTAISKFGGSSMSFDGTGDYLDLPLSLNFSQQGSWTVEMWIYPTTANNCYLYSQVTSNFLQLNLAGNMILYVDRSGVGNLITAGAAISLNTWTHIALVSEGTTVKLYINGTQSGSTASYSTVTASATTTRIGAYQNSGSAGTLLYYGYIDDLRITKGYARYTSNFTPPTTAFPVY